MSRFIRIDNAASDTKCAYFRELLPEGMTDRKGCRLIGAADDSGIPEGWSLFP